MSVGHDHDNDYGGFYYNVELIYGRKTGFGSYVLKSYFYVIVNNLN